MNLAEAIRLAEQIANRHSYRKTDRTLREVATERDARALLVILAKLDQTNKE